MKKKIYSTMLCIIMLISGCARQQPVSYYKIAYNHAQELGFEGDLNDFINMIKGSEGRGIQSIILNEDGELILTYTDGEIVNLGKIKGENGKDGIDGKDGLDGLNGKDGLDGRDGKDGINGRDGKDGRSIKSVTVSENGDIQIILTDDSIVSAGNIARYLCQNIRQLDYYPLDGGKFAVMAGKAVYLSEIILPEVYLSFPVTEILEGAFSGCQNLKSVTIPKSVEIIGAEAFSDCPNLESVIIYAENPPILGKHAFHKTFANIFVLNAEAYKNAGIWKDYADRIFQIV